MERVELLLEELFTDLHVSGIWSDEKYISDAQLNAHPKTILAKYREEKGAPEFSLQRFFETHFTPIATEETGFFSDSNRTPTAHIQALWPFLHREADRENQRSTKYPLPYSYVVPGGRFQEVYYWDSYFTQIGLLLDGHHRWVADLLDNFAHCIDRFGHIPNGNRTYFLSRSQPPFFSLMVHAYAEQSAEPLNVYRRYLPALKAEYAYWMAPHRNRQGLTRYWDEENSPRIEMLKTDLKWGSTAQKRPNFYRHLRAACESGWDFSSRWLDGNGGLESIRTLDIAPVDLNSLLYFHETLLFDVTGEKCYQTAAEKRKTALQKVFYTSRGFEDVFFETLEGTHVLSAASLFPLFVGAATQSQADFTAEKLQTTLLQKGGLSTTSSHTGEQWDAPNGWAPLQWIAVQGLMKYGHEELAKTIAQRWIKTCDTIYHAKGKFVEKYNVYEPENLSKGGEYEVQDGFGWSNGVYRALTNFLAQS